MIKELETQMWEAAVHRDSKGFLRLVDENAVIMRRIQMQRCGVCGGDR